MYKHLLILVFTLFGFITFGQQYPLVTIQDIQFVPDSLLIAVGGPPSPLMGDTVRVRGVVMVRPVVDPTTDRRRIIAAGARWSIYVQDQVTGIWGGLNVIQHDTTGANQNSFFDLVDTAEVVEFTGVISEFSNSTTQMDILVNPTTPVSIIGNLPRRPDPIELNLTDFRENGAWKPNAEKYEGSYFILRNVITSDRNTSNGTFRVNDGNGNYITMYDQSGFFTLRSHRLSNITTFQPPQDGSILEYIRGIGHNRLDGYYIIPLYPGDIGPVVQSPPVVSSIRRNITEVTSNTPVEISAKITDLDGTVVAAEVRYRVNDGARLSVPMTWSASDSLYKGTIPGVPNDSAIVNFYLWAKDNQDLTVINPSDTLTRMFFYPVLNRPLTIQDVQYSPFGGGFSGYNNYRVTLTGVVTADTSDLPGFGSTPLRVYMQNGQGPWSGIQIGTTGSMGISVLNLVRGDNVTVSGLIRDVFDVTRIDSLTAITVNSSGNTLPNPKVLTTGSISTGGNNAIGKEEWESVLVEYPAITITNINADGGSNFGEMLVSDGSGNTRVELEDGNHSYHNGTRPLRPVLVVQGATLQALRGILYFSFSNYKLAPRKDDDFVGYVTAIDDENSLPTTYGMSQNYPNPFNPSTIINYSLPREEFVTIKIYNVLGQVVKTLVNQTQVSGNHKISFDARDLTSGIYFYSINAGSFNQVKKMMLLK